MPKHLMCFKGIELNVKQNNTFPAIISLSVITDKMQVKKNSAQMLSCYIFYEKILWYFFSIAITILHFRAPY
jgi:hypothetical protein